MSELSVSSVCPEALGVLYYLHNKNLYTLKISSFLDMKMDINRREILVETCVKISIVKIVG